MIFSDDAHFMLWTGLGGPFIWCWGLSSLLWDTGITEAGLLPADCTYG